MANWRASARTPLYDNWIYWLFDKLVIVSVSVIYVSQTGKLYHKILPFCQEMSVQSAIMASGFLLLPEFSDFKAWFFDNLDTPVSQKVWYVGIFSQKKPLSASLQDGDRIEIYRPLPFDPMASRKQKVLAKKQKI